MKRRCKISCIVFNNGNPAGSPNWNAAFAMNQLVFLNERIGLADSVRLDDMLMAADACSIHRESTVRIEPLEDLEDEESEEEDDDPSKKDEDPSPKDKDPSPKDEDPSKKDEDPSKEK